VLQQHLILFYILAWNFSLQSRVSPMAIKMKGIFKGLKIISQMFGNSTIHPLYSYFVSALLEFKFLWIGFCIHILKIHIVKCMKKYLKAYGESTSTWLDICSFTVHKEHEMEIEYPTYVKHLVHIGLDTSDTSPSWVRTISSVVLYLLSWVYTLLT
jgi:hypothetical protein